MKITYFLRGLGIGIIFSALILSLAFHTSDSSMTDEQVIERAKELGMVEAGESDDALDKLLSQEDKEGQQGDNQKKEQTDTATTEAISTEAATTEEMTTEEATTEAVTTEEATTEVVSTEAPKKVSITISRGMFSEKVSETLASLGVIDNASHFNKYLNDNGYAGRLVVGTYEVTPGEDYASIAKKITGR